MDDIASLAWDFARGIADYGNMQDPAAQAAYNMIISISGLFIDHKIDQSAASELKQVVLSIYSDVHAGRYKT